MHRQVVNEARGNAVASSWSYQQPTDWPCSSQGHPLLLWSSPTLKVNQKTSDYCTRTALLVAHQLIATHIW